MKYSYISQATRITLAYKRKCYDWKPAYTASKLLIVTMIELFDNLLNNFSF